MRTIWLLIAALWLPLAAQAQTFPTKSLRMVVNFPPGGAAEIIVGGAIARGFENTRIGDQLHFAQRHWTVVGTFDAGGSGFDSEIWGDVDQLMQAFRRTAFSTVVLRLADADRFDQLRADTDSDPRLTSEMKRERTF